MPLIYLTDHIPIAWRSYYSIQFPVKTVTELPISDRPAEALAILTRENHKQMSMKYNNILFNYFYLLYFILRAFNSMVNICFEFAYK